MLVSLTVGKVDAGVAVLLTQDKRLIEFPSILLPQSITSGSIVDITVSQNHAAEQKATAAFDRLQSEIVDAYGLNSPATPKLRLRNATQTSIVLEWDPIDLQTSTLRSLALYRNGQKAGNIPRPFDMHSTKISGLQVETEYSFYLVLRTSGGTYTSNVLSVKTHSMANLTGITVTPGVLPAPLRASLEAAVQRIGARISETIRIDTTHFVCTEGRGRDWERANEMSIPIVRPEWIEGCEREGKLIGVRAYYLDANPKHRQIGSNPKLERGAVAGAGAGAAAAAAAVAGAAAAAGAAGADATAPADPRQNANMASPESQAALAAAAEKTTTTATATTNGKEEQQKPDKAQEDAKAESEVEGEPGPEVTGTPVVETHSKAVHSGQEEDDDEDDSEDQTHGDAEKQQQSDSHAHAHAGENGEDDDGDEDEDEDEDEDKAEEKEEKDGEHEKEEEEDDDDDDNDDEDENEDEETKSKEKSTKAGDTSGELEDVAL